MRFTLFGGLLLPSALFLLLSALLFLNPTPLFFLFGVDLPPFFELSKFLLLP